jgi:hypothetical protein
MKGPVGKHGKLPMATVDAGMISPEDARWLLFEDEIAGFDGVDSPLAVNNGVVTLGISIDEFARNPKTGTFS